MRSGRTFAEKKLGGIQPYYNLAIFFAATEGKQNEMERRGSDTVA